MDEILLQCDILTHISKMSSVFFLRCPYKQINEILMQYNILTHI